MPFSLLAFNYIFAFFMSSFFWMPSFVLFCLSVCCYHVRALVRSLFLPAFLYLFGTFCIYLFLFSFSSDCSIRFFSLPSFLYLPICRFLSTRLASSMSPFLCVVVSLHARSSFFIPFVIYFCCLPFFLSSLLCLFIYLFLVSFRFHFFISLFVLSLGISLFIPSALLSIPLFSSLPPCLSFVIYYFLLSLFLFMSFFIPLFSYSFFLVGLSSFLHSSRYLIMSPLFSVSCPFFSFLLSPGFLPAFSSFYLSFVLPFFRPFFLSILCYFVIRACRSLLLSPLFISPFLLSVRSFLPVCLLSFLFVLPCFLH